MSKVKESNFILTCKFRAYPSELLKYISFEELNIKGPVKNHHLAKAILDAGWGTLITLAERIHRCPNCGAELNRDYKTSVNILHKGLTHLTGSRDGASRTYVCGEGSPSLKQESLCRSSV